MSDTENKTKNKAETKIAETTSYLKKDKQQGNQTESSKSNMVIPLVLLLVSATVIFSTFYADENEYEALVAQEDSVTDSLEHTTSSDATTTEETASENDTSTDVAATEEAASVNTSSTDVAAIKEALPVNTASTDVAAIKEALPVNTASTDVAAIEEKASEVLAYAEQTASTTEKQENKTEVTAQTTEANITAITSADEHLPATITKIAAVETVEITSAEDGATAEPANNSASNQMPVQNRFAPNQRQPYASKQAYEQARKEAKARALEKRKKHNEIMRQHRQAYKKEMQAKREQYEAEKKAYQERRAKIAEEQKAIDQQVEQNRIETMQKMKQIHKEISDMNKRMRQMMMRDLSPQFKNDSVTPKQSPKTEQIESS